MHQSKIITKLTSFASLNNVLSIRSKYWNKTLMKMNEFMRTARSAERCDAAEATDRCHDATDSAFEAALCAGGFGEAAAAVSDVFVMISADAFDLVIGFNGCLCSFGP